MLTKVQKWGNSLGLRIPRSFAVEARVEPGVVVDISLERGGLMVRRPPIKKYLLRELIQGITKGNLHGEVMSGGPLGREDW